MEPIIRVDNPQDVSNILFQKKTEGPRDVQSYVGPIEVVVACNDYNGVAHGRGVVATRNIQAGELLFVTPPTVEAAVEDVYQRWLDRQTEENNPTSSSCLEDCAEQTLLDAMQEACTTQPKIAASLAVLIGSDKSIVTTAPPISVLLGQETDTRLSFELLARDDLLQIVRANAFGPDGLHSYARVEKEWKAKTQTNESTLLTPRLLGIYPLAAMLNHSCVANAVRVYAGRTMVVHAASNIAAGTEVVWPYVPPTQPHRRTALQKQHGFVCACDRCVAEDAVLPAWEAMNPSEWQVWNQSRLADDILPSYNQLYAAINNLEERLTTATEFSNQLRRYVRIGYLHLYINYLNVALSHLQNQPETETLRNDLLNLATQLHFSLCAAHHASTEHLSVRRGIDLDLHHMSKFPHAQRHVFCPTDSPLVLRISSPNACTNWKFLNHTTQGTILDGTIETSAHGSLRQPGKRHSPCTTSHATFTRGASTNQRLEKSHSELFIT